MTTEEIVKNNLAVCPECGGAGHVKGRSSVELLCHTCYGRGVVLTSRAGKPCDELLELLGHTPPQEKKKARLSAA